MPSRPTTSSGRPRTSPSHARPLTSGGWGTHVQEEEEFADDDSGISDPSQWGYAQDQYGLPDTLEEVEEQGEQSDDDEDLFAFGLPENDAQPLDAETPVASIPSHQHAHVHAGPSQSSMTPADPPQPTPPYFPSQASPPFSQTIELRHAFSPTTYGALTPVTSTSALQPLAAHYHAHADVRTPGESSRPGLLQPNSPPSTSTTLSYPLGSDTGEIFRMRSLPGTATASRRPAARATISVREGGKLSGHSEVHVTLSSDGQTSLRNKASEASIGDELSEREGSLKTSTNTAFETEEEEDSPYLEVRTSVSNIDDPSMPVFTFRVWTMGMGMCILASAMNTFFNFRYPSPKINSILVLLLSYPVGKLMAYTLPMRTFHLPRWLGGYELSLNPGPFNVKEHTLILIMADVAIAPAYSMNVIVVSELYYRVNLGVAFNFILVLCTQLTGFGLAGMCRRFLVWPPSMIWPQNLVASTLLNTLHAEEDVAYNSAGMSRYRLFMIASVAAFFWYFLPGYLFQGLSAFSWVCWIMPNNIPINQLFGTETGLGMGILTFDWSQITYINSPLMMPWWSELQVGIGFVLAIWMLTPTIYYLNIWNFAYLPMNSDVSFDLFGLPYNVSQVLDANFEFNLDQYNAYSPVWMSCTFVILYLFSFSVATAALTHTLLHNGQTLWNGVKRINVEKEDIHVKLMKQYPEVPHWWYISFALFFFALSIVACQVWPTNLPIWGLLLCILIPAIYVIPAGYIYALTGLPLGVNLVAESIAGTFLQGRPVANMIFKAYAYETLSNSLAFVQDLKLGHYLKIPPRVTFISQAIATILASVVQVGIKVWMFANVPDICKPTQPHQLTCPNNEVFFTASVIWGLIGPSRQFGAESVYWPILFALVFGAIAPIPFWFLGRRYPNSIWRSVNMPVVLLGPTMIPPATGINYSAWFLVGFLTQYVVRRRFFRWWEKYNYILSSALDSGTIISILFIFFILQLPRNGSLQILWWGNTVSNDTADANAVPLYPVPPGGLTRHGSSWRATN